MYIVSNIELKKHKYKTKNYFLDYDENTYLELKNNYIFVFEGYIYPDIKYTEQDMRDFFINNEKKDNIKKFKGKYSGVFINKKENTITFFNDQLGIRDLFYYKKNKEFIVSNKFSKIMNNISFHETDIDNEALTEFKHFKYPLFDRTFHKHIKLLPIASIYTLKRNRIEKHRFWKYEFVEDKNFDKNKAIKKIDILFDQSMKRIIKKHGENKTYGLGLSGGHDSRLVAHYAKKNKLNLKTFIFGENNSEAYDISKKLAKKLNVEHKELGYDKNYLKHYKKSIKYNPMLELGSLWYYSIYEKLPQFKTLLTGFNGDNTFGSHLPKKLADDNETLSEQIIKKYSTKKPQESIVKEIEKYLKNINGSPMSKFEDFNYNFRQIKFIKNNTAFNFLGKYQGESIFEDIDLVEYLLTIPFEWRYDKKLYMEFFKEVTSELYKIKAEREPRFKNKQLALVEKIIRHLDLNILQTEIFFKKSHKRIDRWLKNNTYFKNKIKEIINDYEPNKTELNKLKNRIINGKADNKEITIFFNMLTINAFLKEYLTKEKTSNFII